METVGYVAPETAAEAREIYEELGPVAQELVREVAIAMGADREEYDERVTADVIATARDALFGGLLVVTTGERVAFDRWRDHPPYEDYEVEIEGSEHVDSIAWHAAPLEDRIIAATYQAERDAAVATLRRMAWGRIYHDVITEPTED